MDPSAFTESALKMTFLTILGVTKILYAVSDPVLEGSEGKKISESSRLRVHIKVFSKQFCFIRCRRQHHWAVEQRRYSRLTFVDNTIKFGSFKNPSATIILAYLNFPLDSEDLFYWYKLKNKVSVNYGSSTSN